MVEWRRVAGDRHTLSEGFRRTRFNSSCGVECCKLSWKTCMVGKADAKGRKIKVPLYLNLLEYVIC